MKILSNKDIQDIVKQTIEHDGISSLELIERVAQAITEEIVRTWPENVPVIIFAGWGGNGADALEIAKLLALHGFKVDCYLFNIGGKLLTHDCKKIYDRLRANPVQGLRLKEITGREPFSWPEPDPETLIIDGLFGAGLDRPMPKPLQMLARNINESQATVISIDVPSGLQDEWNHGAPRAGMVNATVTYAVGFPRLSFFFGENAQVVGKWEVLDVGFWKDAVRRAPLTYFLVTSQDVKRFLSPRQEFSSKADFGHLMICAGSYGMMGAAVLSASGALRSGVGKVTVHSAKCGCQILQTSVPCAMFDADKATDVVSDIPNETKYNTCVVGPGLGRETVTADALEHFLKAMSASSRPVVLDADALNIIASRPTMLGYLPVLSVLTPHAGEFDRLFGNHASEEERLRKAIEVSAYHQIIIVLKGRYTKIVRPDGKVFINSSGTPAMATAGSGDVLSGLIGSFMAQGLKPEIAALVGVYVHGVAGEMAADSHGQYGVTATDIANRVGAAIMNIQNA